MAPPHLRAGHSVPPPTPVGRLALVVAYSRQWAGALAFVPVERVCPWNVLFVGAMIAGGLGGSPQLLLAMGLLCLVLSLRR